MDKEEDVEVEEDEMERKRKKKTCYKHLLSFVFSALGLFLVLMLYVAAGAELFVLLEAPNEEHERQVGLFLVQEENYTYTYKTRHFQLVTSFMIGQ